MALNNYQFSFNGLTFGAGTPFVITEVMGLEDLPAIRNQDDNRGYNDGMFTGRDFFSGRTITFMFNILAGNGNTAQANYALFQAALNPQQTGTTALNFLLSPADTQKVIYGRVRTRAVPVTPEYTYGKITAQVTIFCPDPRYYASTSNTLSLTPAASSGRTYNRTYNLTYGGGSQSGSGTVVNNGWATTNPVVTITGPALNPVLSNVTTGQNITINFNMGASDVVVIDLNLKTVTLNGTSARNILANSSQWFSAPPGSTQLSFSATTFTAGVTTCVVSYSPAFV
jgi:phage-related protein